MGGGGRRGARVVGGELGGRGLTVAGATRPSSAQLRAALASIWTDRIAGARVLDLFAGSGAVGLELLSRGAVHTTFVESDRASSAALAENLELLAAGRSRRLALDARRALELLAREGARFDLIFVDPPYELELDEPLLGALRDITTAHAGARLHIEQPRMTDVFRQVLTDNQRKAA